LRFGPGAAEPVQGASALRVEGTIRHPDGEESWEYCVVISVRDEKGTEVARHVVDVGALAQAQNRTFSLSVDVLPPRGVPTAKRN
jgi:hypothetical protein